MDHYLKLLSNLIWFDKNRFQALFMDQLRRSKAVEDWTTMRWCECIGILRPQVNKYNLIMHTCISTFIYKSQQICLKVSQAMFLWNYLNYQSATHRPQALIARPFSKTTALALDSASSPFSCLKPRVCIRKARAIFKSTGGAKLAWAESKAEAVVSKKARGSEF